MPDTAACKVHKHSPTLGSEVCPTCGRFIPDEARCRELLAVANADRQGCSELTCIYHHHAVQTWRDIRQVAGVLDRDGNEVAPMTQLATCDGYEWRGEVPWKCKLPPGHKTPDGTFLGRSCKGNDPPPRTPTCCYGEGCETCRPFDPNRCCDRPGVNCAGCGSENPECPVHHVCPGGGWR